MIFSYKYSTTAISFSCECNPSLKWLLQHYAFRDTSPILMKLHRKVYIVMVIMNIIIIFGAAARVKNRSPGYKPRRIVRGPSALRVAAPLRGEPHVRDFKNIPHIAAPRTTARHGQTGGPFTPYTLAHNS
jgi:hypothetical protein